MSKNIFLCVASLFSSVSYAQIGGRHSFEFLNVPASARQAALGGVNVSLAGRDVNLFYANPALLTDTLSGWASAGHQFYLADVGQSAFSYAHDFGKIGLVGFGVQHIGYGTIAGYDATGAGTGDFKSGETAVIIGKSHRVSHFRFGVNLKTVFSSIAGYRAGAVMVDLGGVFIHPDQDVSVGLSIRNLGFVLSEYSETGDTSLPFDVQLGASFKPEHMPVRFSFTAYHLTQANIAYYNAADGNEEPGTLDKVLRHLNFGAEILLHRNVDILFGYNYLIHKELKLDETGGGAGVSAGICARIRAFEFTFSRNSYVVGTAGYSLTLAADIKNMWTRQ